MELWIYILTGIVVLSLFYILVTYYSLIRLNFNVKESFAGMDVYLKKRWDLIPDLVQMVKRYAKHEKDTLEEVIRIRSGIYDMMSPDDKIYTNEQLRTDISKIMAIVEKYPDLKANQNFLDLSTQLSSVENYIADTRMFYNAAARIINSNIRMFPNNMVAKMFHFKKVRMFEAKAPDGAIKASPDGFAIKGLRPIKA